MPPGQAAFHTCNYLLSLLLSHFWFAIPQLVLQADWQEVWHSPQPPFFALSHRLRVSMVLICSIFAASTKDFGQILPYSQFKVKTQRGFPAGGTGGIPLPDFQSGSSIICLFLRILAV